ncbi:hypothetical protein [Streptomyces sp. NPDC048612]
MDCLLDAFGPAPLEGDSRSEVMSSTIRWIAAQVGELPYFAEGSSPA